MAFGFCYWPWHLESLALAFGPKSLALALIPQGLGLGLGSQVLVNITGFLATFKLTDRVGPYDFIVVRYCNYSSILYHLRGS